MLMRLVRGDLRRNTVTTMALVALLTIATALVAAGAGTVATVSGSLDRLFARAKVPDAMQMHSGEIDERAILEWATRHPDVADVQVVTTYPLPVGKLTIGGHPQSDSALQPSATAQSPSFDQLLGLDNSVLDPPPAPSSRLWHIGTRYSQEVRSFWGSRARSAGSSSPGSCGMRR